MQIKSALEQFKRAAQNLDNEMKKATSKQADAFTGHHFPFDLSFEDVTANITEWVDLTIKNLESKDCPLCGGVMFYQPQQDTVIYQCTNCPGMLTVVRNEADAFRVRKMFERILNNEGLAQALEEFKNTPITLAAQSLDTSKMLIKGGE